MNNLKIIKKMLQRIFVCTIFCFSTLSMADDFKLTTTDNPSDLLILDNGQSKLHLLDKMGPVFEVEDNLIRPENYTTKVTSVQTEGGIKKLKCLAEADDLKAEYEIWIEQKSDTEVTFTISGSANVSEFQIGKITGSEQPFKQFYTGEREMESFPKNDGMCPMIYWPAGDIYIYTNWDMSYTNSAVYKHRLLPKENFLAKNPPVGCDFFYAVLSDGSRPKLKERFTICFSKNLWDSYGKKNNPSEYRQELAGMVYFDSWSESFTSTLDALKWIKQVTDGRTKLYTIIQTWADWKSWDASNPDAYRIPDHNQTGEIYGNKAQLLEIMNIAKSMGRAGLRCNYMHIGQDSWSVKEGFVKHAIDSKGQQAWYTDFNSVKVLVEKQENDIKKDFAPTTAFHDQWASGGCGWPIINFDSSVKGAGTLSGTAEKIKEICKFTKGVHNGPLSSETLNGEFLIGEFIDTGDYGIYGADDRFDISPEYKLRRLHEQTVLYGMGLGYRFYFGPWEDDWAKVDGVGYQYYYNNDEQFDKYRACEILWGNGAYLFFRGNMRKVHILDECMTVGIAQKYYVLQPVEYVKYSKTGIWKTFDKIIRDCNSSEELFQWQHRFHIKFKNGCHIWVNRSPKPMQVRYLTNKTIKLPQDGWLIYTEDGNLVAYTALTNDSVVAGSEGRVIFCEDKNQNIKYVNPRKLLGYEGVNKPTIWVNGKHSYTLDDPETTFRK
jgi:hypothetical protein